MQANPEQPTTQYVRRDASSPAMARHNSALEDLVEEFSARLERGERPQIEEFVTQHPEHADRLRRILPTMQMLADFSRSEQSVGLVPQNPLADAVGQDGTLGDFRIIREVGRGGMGVVYEAQQISLSRRVALKILPFAAVLDPRHLQRFKNEALAAAHLDHPNIVEVYGVGCERGIHFYAMRFVEGQTLAAVIEALQQDGRAGDVSPPISLSHGQSANDDNVAGTLRVPSPHTDCAAYTDTVAAALSTLRETKPRDYCRRIAELGIQAAEALDHAHQMGIVHRDIKPSNLILQCSHLAPRDVAYPSPSGRGQGEGKSELRIPHSKLYITDFGLARFQSDPGMTMTGDLIGTDRKSYYH